jgi:hypothetical protein
MQRTSKDQGKASGRITSSLWRGAGLKQRRILA